MKTSFFVLALILSQYLFSQIVYKPTFIDQCTNKPAKNVYWEISDAIKSYGNSYSGMDKVTLPKTGNYKLNCRSISVTPIDINISTSGTVKDTFLTSRLDKTLYIGSDYDKSEYLLCGSLVNGEITDYFSNGKKRMEGTFKKGQPIDSMFTYYRSGLLYNLTTLNKNGFKSITYFDNGQVKNLKTPNKNGFKSITYYDNGQVKAIAHVNHQIKGKCHNNENKIRERVIKNTIYREYYPDGYLKIKQKLQSYKKCYPIDQEQKEKNWSKTFKRKSTGSEYFPDGTLKINRENKKVKIYNENAILIAEIQRKRIFDEDFLNGKHFINDKYYVNYVNSIDDKFYKYKWEKFDSEGVIIRSIIFNHDESVMNSFPELGIHNFLFDKIISYVNGIAFKKLDFRYVKMDNKYIKKVISYKKVQGKWVEEKQIDIPLKRAGVSIGGDNGFGLQRFIHEPLNLKKMY